MLFSDYLDLEPRHTTLKSDRKAITTFRATGRQPRWNFTRVPVVGDVGKDCPAANSVLEPAFEQGHQDNHGDGLSTSPVLTGRSWAASRNLSWVDLGSVLGNLVGGTLFIGGMFLLPYALRHILTLL